MSIETDIEGGPGAPGRPLPSILLSGGGDVSLHNGRSALVHLTVSRSLTSTAVTLSVGNLPPGVSAHLSSATLPSGTGNSSVTLTLTAAASALAAQAAVRVTASGVNVLSDTLIIHVMLVSPFSEIAGAPLLPINASGQSSVTSSSPVVLVVSGQAMTGVNLQLAAGVVGSISLAISGLPSGVTAQFDPPTLAAPGQAGPMGVQILLGAGPGVLPATVNVTVLVSVGERSRGTLILPLQIIASLASLNNYFLYSSCNPLLGLSVTINVTEDLVAAFPTTNQQHGFSFQLNASSPQNAANPNDPNWIVWQQYIIGVGSGKIRGAVNNWTAASLTGTQTINPVIVLATLPQPDMIPAGYSLTIALTIDAQSNVNGVTFGVNPGGSQEITLTSLTKTGGQPVTAADLAPIVAFELNLVGPGDRKIANFISGAGTITYTASTPLQLLGYLPSCVADPVTTGEKSNSIYGTLPSLSSNTFTQAFTVKITPVGVPHLIGLSPSEVLGALANVGLIPMVETTTLPSTTPKPPVCASQQPAAGTQVLQGSSVIYTIHQFVVGSSPPK